MTYSSLPSSSVTSIRSSLPAQKLGFDTNERRLEDEFESWQRERNREARAQFDEMLRENSFVQFWAKLGKIGGEGMEGGGVKRDETGFGEDEGEAGGGNVDMKELAKSVDVGEIEKVLKVRFCFFIVFGRLMRG